MPFNCNDNVSYVCVDNFEFMTEHIVPSSDYNPARAAEWNDVWENNDTWEGSPGYQHGFTTYDPLVHTTSNVVVEDKPKPPLSEQQMFGVGYDVILLTIAYTLAIGFVVKAIRDIADNIITGSSKFDKFLDAVAHSEYLLPVVLGAITGPFAFDLIVRLAEYSHVDPIAGIYMGICAGALSSTVAGVLKRYIRKHEEKIGIAKPNIADEIEGEE